MKMLKFDILVLVVFLLPVLAEHETNWQHVLDSDFFQGEKDISSFHAAQPSFSSIIGHDYQQPELHGGDRCEVHKVAFTQDLYFQYVQYKTIIPELKEFTLCFWSKFTNHTNDHPLFSYAVDGQPRAIYSWVSNTDRSSYFSLSVEGHTFYRLNYPLRLNRWYHTCQSWNGKTGEWQIWINAERVGRGFHNRLVGHVIPQGGIAITGQEQSQLGGGFQEGPGAPKGAGGMLGEVTMVQLYKVALTAGKAHRDHKHHHAHQYDHNGEMITTPAPTTQRPRSSLPTHPLLTGGQLNPNLRLNFAGGQPGQQPQIVPGQQFDAQFLNGQFVGNLVTQQLQSQRGAQQFLPQSQDQTQISDQEFFRDQPQLLPALPTEVSGQNVGSFSRQTFTVGNKPLVNSGLVHPSLTNPANVKFVDSGEFETHQLFKRQHQGEAAGENIDAEFGKKIVQKTKREAVESTEVNKHKKRELFVGGGSILEGGFVPSNSEDYEQSLLYGLAGIGQNEPIIEQQKQSEEREPAEAEVKAVMNICSGCDSEPFGKALVFGWRTVPKKLYSGAYLIPAVPECRVF